MPTNDKGSLSLEEQLKQGLIAPGVPFPIRQHVELSFADDTIEKLQESNRAFKLTESEGGTDKKKLIVTVEGIHTGMTKNKTFYPGDTLSESVPTWTTPHHKPVLKNHDEYTEPLGRIVSGEYVESTLTDKYTVRLKLEVSDEQTIEKILDGRYLTLSVGGSANKVICSACAKDLVTEGYCGHQRGRTYEGKEAYWTIAQYTGDEISFVNMPADVHAQVIAAELVSAKGGSKVEDGKTKESTQATDGSTGIQTTESNQQPDAASLIDNMLGGDEGTQKENTQTDEPKAPVNTKEGNDNSDNDNTDQEDEKKDPSSQQENESEELKKLKADLLAAQQEVATMKESIEKAEATETALVAERDEAKTNLETEKRHREAAEAEKKVMEDQNIALARFARKTMAERVVDLRILQGKDKMDDRERLLEEWSGSNAKVLESTIKDLLESSRRHVETIVSPVLALGENNAPIVDDEGDIVKPKKTIESKPAPTLGDFGKTLQQSIFR